MIHVQGYVQDYNVVCLNGDLSTYECHYYVVHVTTNLDLESLEIRRSGFYFKSNLTSVISDLANCDILASYVSRPNAMVYDTHPHK
jgi:hypothetical protein